jgi:hypothetical protein
MSMLEESSRNTLQTLSLPNLAKPKAKSKPKPKPKEEPPRLINDGSQGGNVTWLCQDGRKFTSPDWASSFHARYGPDFAERTNVPAHYPRRPRLKDPQFYGVSSSSCKVMPVTRAPAHGVMKGEGGLTEDDMRKGVHNTAQKVELVDLFFNWTGAFGGMVADQNKRMAHTMSTSSRQRDGVKWVLNSSIKERDNLSLTFGQKFKGVKSSEGKAGESINRRAGHLYNYVNRSASNTPRSTKGTPR